MRSLICLLGSILVLSACSAGAGTSNGYEETSGAGGSGGSDVIPTGSGGAGGDLIDGAGGGAIPPDDAAAAEVFGHSPDVLYRLDPLTRAITTVGSFSGCSKSVIDIAIDKDGAMFATTFGGLFRVDKATAQCTSIKSGSFPNSLSFVPKGTLDANEEALVGYIGSSYVRIDKVTGAVTTVGKLANNYTSSGDVVSVIGGKTYLTVKGPDCSDCIVTVDPKTGALTEIIGALGHTDVFGLAFWGGSAYGFSDGGQLFEIDLKTAASTTIPMPNAPNGLSFYGAGSTTSAPLVVPK